MRPTPDPPKLRPGAAGVTMALAAYAWWGLLPLYLKPLAGVDPLQILAHRTLWSLPLLAVALLLHKDRRWVDQLRVATALRLAASAALLGCNWGLNIWAINRGQVLAASLGFFINPLLSVALGAVVLGERLTPAQWVAVAIAASGVVWLALQQGEAPWLAFGIAASFAGYGLLRKTAPLSPLPGLTLEALWLAPLALSYLIWGLSSGHDSFAGSGWERRAWLICAGPVTTVPLLLYAASARRLPLALLGMLQYLTPSLLLALGVRLYGEPFGADRAHGFALVWAGCALYLTIAHAAAAATPAAAARSGAPPASRSS